MLDIHPRSVGFAILPMRKFFLLAGALLFAWSSPAATFTVSSPADSGAGTLRQAILDANATAGRDTIVFTSGASPNSAMPPITDAVDIDGTIGTGRAVVAPTAVLATALFTFSTGSDTSTLRDLIIDLAAGPSSSSMAIDPGVSGVVIAGNALEGDSLIRGNNNLIGGAAPADSNEIGNNLAITSGGTGNQVRGNTGGFYSIHTAPGTQITDNVTSSISVTESPSTVVEGNTVTGTLGGAISLSQASPLFPPLVEENLIQNSLFGVAVSAPNAVIRSNTIQDMSISGVRVSGVTGVEITGNSIFDTPIAIELTPPLGPNPNDPAPDADTGANDLQNFPVLTSAALAPGVLSVEGTLTSAPNTPYQIELFSNPPGEALARTFLGSFSVTTNAAGVALFAETVTSPPLPAIGDSITATATNRASVSTPGNTPNSTSEVSSAVIVSAAAVAAVPTLSEWAMLALIAALAAVALLRR
jgi:trimeric autotransporter adhesin